MDTTAALTNRQFFYDGLSNTSSRLTSGRDMKVIYRGLYSMFPNGFPEILIFDKLENDVPLMVQPLPNGNRIYYLKNDTDEAILQILSKELRNPTCDVNPKFPYVHHNMSEYRIAEWVVSACYIADTLNIPMNQIVFSSEALFSSCTPNKCILISDRLDSENMLATIAHELRHVWQETHNSEWLKNYKCLESGIDAYVSQMAEVDAEAFCLKLFCMVSGIDYIKIFRHIRYNVDLGEEYQNSILNRMKEIDIILSAKKINILRKYLEYRDVA